MLITLPRAARLTRTTAAARTSCLAGEHAGGMLGGIGTGGPGPPSTSFEEFVAVRHGAQTRWGDRPRISGPPALSRAAAS